MRLLALLLLLCTGALADDDAFRRCRQIGDPAARLKCYDALPLPSAAPRPAPAPSAAPGPASSAAKPDAGAGIRQAPEQFGLEYRGGAEVKQIESYIPGHFTGYRVNTRIRLANGQVWQVTDGSPRKYDRQNPKVVIRRGAFGTFFMDIDENADNFSSPRVKRVE